MSLMFHTGPYACFIQEHYQDTAKAFPDDYTRTEIIKELSKAWKALPEEEKAAYVEKFSDLQKAKWASRRVSGVSAAHLWSDAALYLQTSLLKHIW